MLKIQELREIIKLIDQSSLQEFELESEGTKLTLRKGSSQQQVSGNMSVPVGQVPPTSIEPVSVPEAELPVSSPMPQQNDTDAVADEHLHKIVSPMVGTFYSRPEPNASAFVGVGDQVKPDTVVCIVEAMKLFNEIEAEASGEVVEVLVADGQLVEYGQPLFSVRTKS